MSSLLDQLKNKTIDTDNNYTITVTPTEKKNETKT